MTRVIKAIVACLLLLCVQMAHSQELYQTAAKWELKDNNNDPTIATSGYKKIRIKFSTTLSLSFSGTKGDPYPTTLLLEGSYKFSGFYFLSLHLQVYKNGEWERNTIDLQLTSWGEVLARDEETLHKVYNDFLSGSKARIRVGMSGEDWYEVSLASFKAVAKGVFTAGQRTASANQTNPHPDASQPPIKSSGIKPQENKGSGIQPSTQKIQASTAQDNPKRDQYGFPLILGDKDNKWVRILQRAFLPESQWNGNYDEITRKAIAKYLVDENIAYDWGEGNVTTLDLYNDIVTRKFNLNNKSETTNAEKITSKETSDAATTMLNQTQINRQSEMVYFPIRLGFGKDGNKAYQSIVYNLQYAVNATPTGILDKETIENIKAFISDKKNKEIMGSRQPDPEDVRLLNNTTLPAISMRLYDIVMDLADEIGKRSEKVVN